MDDPSERPFEDPALKAALRRALPGAGATAPDALRARIAAIATDARPATSPGADRPAVAGRIGFRNSPWYRVAVAAVIVVGFGALAYRLYEQNRPPTYDATTAIKPEVYQEMVAARDRRAAGQAGPDTVAALEQAGPSLGKLLGRGVFAPDLSSEGWAFRGAAIRKVGGYDAAEAFYTKGDQSILVVSLPTNVMSGASDGARYDTTVSGTAIAGVVKGNGLFCIVGASGMGVDEVKAMLAKHEAEFAKG